MLLTPRRFDAVIVGTGQEDVRARTRSVVSSFSSSRRKSLVGHERIELIEGTAHFVDDHTLEVTPTSEALLGVLKDEGMTAVYAHPTLAEPVQNLFARLDG